MAGVAAAPPGRWQDPRAMAPPRLSVLLPVRDGLPWLAPAVESVLAQGEEAALELVAIDDGSRDGSGEWLQARAATAPRLRVVRTGPEGIVAALNRALALAEAPLVARQDADDLSLPGRFRAQLDWLAAHPGVAV